MKQCITEIFQIQTNIVNVQNSLRLDGQFLQSQWYRDDYTFFNTKKKKISNLVMNEKSALNGGVKPSNLRMKKKINFF